ncbi:MULTISPECIES: hypothetical protein [Xenorhabdus]|uniref:hypothetical protein n=1 Tax=Xenorhabdus TaxID=626 RepID=UPI00068C64A8|nr:MULTISPECIES: hypothetical protein [Xenorhabdus]
MTNNYEDNIYKFIAENKKSSNNNDFKWDNPSWGRGITFYSEIKANKSNKTKKLMDKNIIEFAKAYIWNNFFCDLPKALRNIRLFRVLEIALLRVNKEANIYDINHKILDEAISIAYENFAESTVYRIYSDLISFCSFMSKKHMLPPWIIRWSYPFKKNEINKSKQVGSINSLSKQKQIKLPDERVIDFVGRIFSSEPINTRDIFISSIFALLLCAPSRISEIMLLEDDCEVVVKDMKGISRYGLRFYSLKGYGYNTKWIPDPMVPIAKEAIVRLRKLTNNARVVSNLLKSGEDNLYSWLNKSAFETLTVKDLNKLGFVINREDISWENEIFLSSVEVGVISIKAFWVYLLRKKSELRVTSERDNSITYRNLLAINKDQLNSIKGTDIFTSLNAISNDFRSDFSISNVNNIFKRHANSYIDGAYLRFHSHQIRHLLNTMAQRSALSQVQIAHWSGRRNIKDNVVYDHMSHDELSELSRKVLNTHFNKDSSISNQKKNIDSNFRINLESKFKELEKKILDLDVSEQGKISEKIKTFRLMLENIIKKEKQNGKEIL